jgi:hypothetical protein
MGYYLADGIYPKWDIFVKPLVVPEGKKESDFHIAHAAASKNMEGQRPRMEAALEMDDLLYRFVSSGFGGRPEATVAPYGDGWAAAEAGGGAGDGGSHPQRSRRAQPQR